MAPFGIIIVSIVFGILVGILTEVLRSSNKYCNSSYNIGKDSLDIRLYKPEYKVEKVERCYTKNNYNEICKYTVSNYYIAGKNKVGMQELRFYAEVGAYNVGDILTLEISQNNSAQEEK